MVWAPIRSPILLLLSDIDYCSNLSAIISIIKRFNQLLDGSFETLKRFPIFAMSLIFNQMPNAGRKISLEIWRF